MASPPTDVNSGPEGDPWLTVAEFADAMRVQPVTVRSWITKGQLKATRSGKRKWLVRRSELDRMLYGERADTPPPQVYAEMAVDAVEREQARAELDHSVADYEWEIALEQSRMAPPDARFASRIRQIAQAAAWRAASIKERSGDPHFVWEPVTGSAGMTLSYELRPDGNRPGPKDAWERFDRVVSRLGTAMEGSSASAVAGGLVDLASAMRDLADGIERRAQSPRGSEAESGSTGPPGM
jgi:excisionase family DNA binding protein